MADSTENKQQQSNPFSVMGVPTNGDGTTYYYAENGAAMKTTQKTAYVRNAKNSDSVEGGNYYQDWGSASSRSSYNTFVDLGAPIGDNARSLLTSRLWKGVPQLTEEMMGAFDAAFKGHTFFFVKEVPRFMTTGIYKNTNMHLLMKNLKAIIERATLSFSGSTQMSMEIANIDDGNMSLPVPTNVSKKTQTINLSVHEFAGLPVKNAIETWMTGIYDPVSHHGSYHGNLGINGGWCLQNHTMSMLVVQVDPSWTEIMDAAYYNNMMPQDVPSTFDYSKSETGIIETADLTFSCIEHRSAAIMKAAEVYMNNRILKLARTAAFNSRQFVPSKTLFDDESGAFANSEGYVIDNDMNYDLEYSLYGGKANSDVSLTHHLNARDQTGIDITANDRYTNKELADKFTTDASTPPITDKTEHDKRENVKK